jgi:hypothetical protein
VLKENRNGSQSLGIKAEDANGDLKEGVINEMIFMTRSLSCVSSSSILKTQIHLP